MNVELRRNIQEQQERLLALMGPKGSSAATHQQHVEMIKETIVEREDEIVQLRRDYNSLMRQLNEYETLCGIKPRDGKQGGAAWEEEEEREERRRSTAARSPSPGKRKGTVPYRPPDYALRDVHKVCEDMDGKVARQVLLLEMRRLNGSLVAAHQRAEELQSTVRIASALRLRSAVIVA